MALQIELLLPRGEVRDKFLDAQAMQRLAALGTLHTNETETAFSQQQTAALAQTADVLITGWGTPGVCGQQLAQKPRLLVHLGGSVAPVADAAFYRKGGRVCSGNALFARSVAEGTLAYMLAALRRISFWDCRVHAGAWRDLPQNQTLLDRHVGLVGFGAVARALVPMLRPLGVSVAVCADFLTPADCSHWDIEKMSLEELFSASDVVSLHEALTPDTLHMVGEKQLALLQPGSVFVNTARGALVDQPALEKALETGRFQAVLDVYEQEPLPPDSPLCRLENVILMPHMAGPTGDLYPVIGRAMVQEIARYAAGEALQYEILPQAAARMTKGG